jgi:hypothetical protein
MKDIARPLLLANLWTLSQSQSVLVYGSPGTGKTWLLGRFIKECTTQSRKVVPLIAEDYQVSSVSELYGVLGFSQPLPLIMASLGPGSALVIDGLDALRAESSQRAFRELIFEVLQQSPKTTVIISIRTYDLQESREFRSLLRPSYESGVEGLAKMPVDDLSDDELAVAGQQNPVLKALISNASAPVRELLRNPFNLNIAMGLLKEGVSAGEISELTSQVQLLGRYWYHRVESGDLGTIRQKVLHDAVAQMVQSRVLSLPAVDLAILGYEDALQNLFSQEVLRKGSTNRIAFGHNILFDYAVARLLLDEVRLITFIKDDSSRTLFFRPSLTMFFHYLWAMDRDLFWKVASQCDDARDLPERAKVIASSVICEAARDVRDLACLVSEDGHSQHWTFLARVLRAAMAIGVLQTKRRILWMAFISFLSSRMRVDFVNEILTLLANVNASGFASDSDFLNRASRNVIEWATSPATEMPDDRASELSNVVVGRLLPYAIDTYESAPLETSALIRGILARIGSKRSGTNEAFRLSHDIFAIIQNDAELAKEIYIRLYSYVEESEEQTNMGGGPATVSFLSTRKQDYSTALYSLAAKFPSFLEKAPLEAMEAALIAVEREIEREHLRKDRATHKEARFRVGEHFIKYRSDYSEIWDGSISQEHTSLTLLGASLNYLAQTTPDYRDRMISILFRLATVGVIWKRLVEVAGRHAAALYENVKTLLFIGRFISAPEVTVACGELFKQAFSLGLVSHEDSELIEAAIERIPRSHFVRRYERGSSIQKRLLSCIPADKLIHPDLVQKKLKWERDGVRENRPFHRRTFGAYTPHPDELLREEGVDPQSPENALVLEVKNRLATFEATFLSTVPGVEDCERIQDDVYALHNLVREERADAPVLENARGTLIAVAKTIAKVLALDSSSQLLQEARQIAIEGSRDPSPEFDPKYHETFDSPGWGAPVPRIEAGQALGFLIWNHFGDDEIVSAFVGMRRDRVPAVRFQIAHFLPALYKQEKKELFWSTLVEMLRAETTHGVMLGLLDSLGRVCGSEPDRSLDTVELILHRGLPKTGRSEASRALIEVPLVLYIVRDIERAKEVLNQFETNFVRFSRELLDGVFLASHYLNIRGGHSPSTRARAREFMADLIAAAKALLDDSNVQRVDREATTEALKVLDAVATRIVFAFGLEQHGVTGSDVLSLSDRESLYGEVRPLLRQIVDATNTSTATPILPRTAYYLLQLMNGLLAFDPVEILSMAAAVCRAGSVFRFEIDPSARDEAVKLVETALADHRDSLKESAQSVGSLLDVFAKAGWSEAISLTFRLDEAFR